MRVDMFVVPNKCGPVTFIPSNPIAEYNASAIQRINLQYSNLGADPKFQFIEGDIPIQIWITDERKENWQDHGLPTELRTTDDGGKYAPSYIPARLLAGVKEGDSFEMTFNGHAVIVTANQLDYRYGRFGSFESVVAQMMRG